MAFQYLQSLVDNTDFYNENDNENESDVEVDVPEVNSIGNESSGDDDDVSDEVESESVEWTDNLTKVTDQMNDFTEPTGGIHDLPQDSEALDYFKLFLTDEMILMFVQETNRYATQKQAESGRDQYWKPVDEEDIIKYIYINIMFGLHQLPETHLYWSSDPMWRVPAVADVMGRQRFCKIHQYFHLNNSEEQPPRDSTNFDPMFKVRPFLDHVRNICATVYKPNRELSVDEAMIGFKGRLFCKQFMRGKPTPWGLKVWCCAESSTGYILNFRVYTGKGAPPSANGLGYDVVMAMTQPFLDKNHVVFFDNYFSSTKLCSDLLERSTYSCGTIRPNRKGWPHASLKQNKGDVKMLQKGLMLATQWMDKRQVNVISTNADPEMVTVQRRSNSGMVDHQIPASVLSYNSGMFGVDLSDQHRSYYPVGRPSIKWWRYLFSYLIQISIINGFLLMKRANPDAPRTSPAHNQLHFRQNLLKALLKRATTSARRTAETPSMAGTSRPSSAHHFLTVMPGRKRRCYQCSLDGVKMASGRTRETTTGCKMCSVHLHRGHCYSTYHENIKH